MGKRAGLFVFLSTSALLLTGPQVVTAQGTPTPAQQGWSDADRSFWYSAPQGSRLMPLSWLRALERVDDRRPFLAAENIASFGYLPSRTSAAADLPVGFAVDSQDDRRFVRTNLRWLPLQGPAEPWVGLTCSACHTTEIAVGERRVRIDGAPGLGDFQRFSEELDAALVATRDDADGKWGRFAALVLGRNSNRPENQAVLRRAVDEQIRRRAQVATMNGAAPRYGFARVDAFGHIYNQASLFSGGNPPSPPNLSNAPVSYPFLWNVPQHNRVQWNGAVGSARKSLGKLTLDFGAVGRNAGEVIGVFGEVIVTPLIPAYRSSVNIANLARLETMLQRLRPPQLRNEFPGNIDEAAAQRGRAIFQARCSGCHAPLDSRDLGTPIVADMSYFGSNAPDRPAMPGIPQMPNIPPGTDPLMACNAFLRTADTGLLRGAVYDNGKVKRPLRDNDAIIGMLSVTVQNALLWKWNELVAAFLRDGQPLPAPGSAVPMARQAPPAASVNGDPFPNLPPWYRQCVNYTWTGQEAEILGYKARPLTGIWATAPYLHNGSVPNLYQLLLPPERRMPSFFLGSRQYDLQNVGFFTDQSAENWFQFNTRDPQGNILWGNFNGGHDYDNAWLDEGTRRRDLLEYLKTL